MVHTPSASRIAYLDFLRILAILLVLFNHKPAFTLFMNAGSGFKSYAYAAMSVIDKINVPLFFMVSGALLFSKNESLEVVLKRRCLRIVVVICAVGSLYYVIAGKGPLSALPIALLNCDIHLSYWFLYAYLGMLFMLPWLRKIVNGFSRVDFCYLVILHFVLASMIRIANLLLYRASIGAIELHYFSIPLAAEKAIFYVLCGHYLANVLHDKEVTKEQVARFLLAALICTALSCALIQYQGAIMGFSQTFVEVFDYVIAFAAFLLFRWLFLCGKLTFLRTPAALLSSLVFGIYLIDPFLSLLIWPSLQEILEPMLPTLLVTLIWCAVSFTGGGLLTYLLKKNRVIRRYI